MSRGLTRSAAAWALLAPMLALDSAALAQVTRYPYTLEVTPMAGPRVPAVEQRYSAAFDNCQENARITADNAACFVAEFAVQDAALNRTWRRVYRQSARSNRPALLAAQRQWVAERDPFCHRHADGAGRGTIAPISYAACRVELTIRRTMWLEGLR